MVCFTTVHAPQAELSLLAHQATQLNKYRPETCCIIGESGACGACALCLIKRRGAGNFYSLRGEHEKAVLHFGRALSVDR